MKITLGELRHVIAEALVTEFGGLSGKIRKPGEKSKNSRQVRIGKADPDENREMSLGEAEVLFPESTEAWAEVVPDMFPDYPHKDPRSIMRGSVWFKIGDTLRVAFKEAPQIELATWDPTNRDWFPIEAEASASGF